MENNKRRRIYQNRRSLPTRLLAFVLCMVLTLTYSGVNTFAMSDDARGDSEKEIIAFSSLPDGVREQEIRQGEDLSAVTFPDTLQILVEETALVDKNSTSKDKALPKAMQSELPLVETKEEEAENSVKADVEETAEAAKDNTSAEESVEAEKSDTSVEPAQSSDENEPVKETTLKDVTLQNVRWEIDEENSSKPVFSSENAGDSFVFSPVISEQYKIADEAELPKIHVSIRDKETVKPGFEQSAVVDGVKISVRADDGVFKDAKALKVRKVSNSEAEKVKEAIEEKRETGKNVATSYTFDITVLDAAGNEVQPDTEKGDVSVSFQMEEAKNQNLSADIYHVYETGQAEKLETEVKGDEVSAKTEGFSFYTVEFTYGNMQYVLAGDSQVDLSKILAKVGLSGEVTAVSVSNSALFSATKNADNKWLITAHRAFDTREWMKVTIKDVIYEIVVTDSQHPLTVTGGTEGVDYKWEDYAYYLNGGTVVKEPVGKKYILHILTSKALVIEGDATKFKEADGILAGQGGAIVIPEGVTANITLKNTKISPKIYIPPMNVMEGASCNLTLEGENTLIPRLIHSTVGQGFFDRVPAIWVPEGAKLTVSEASTGVLTAESAYENAVIGGWKYGHAGTIIIDGGTLKLDNDGDINSITNISGPCIGGYKKLDGIIINGGKIEATCAQSAPIGMALAMVESLGTIIVNGGTIVTRHQNYFGPIYYYADGIGDVQHYTNVTVKINGGNVDTDFDRTRPKNDSADVYRVKITLSGAGEGQEITSYTLFDGSTISLNDAKTLPNGELYLWLPVNTVVTGVHCNGDDYTGTVRAVNNDNDAQAVFKKGTTGTLTASIKAEHVQGVKLSQATGLSAGDTVYLSFSGVESGYLFKGMCLYKGTTLPPAPREVSSDFTKITDKLYSFTMPAENVTVYLNAPKIRTVSAGEQTHITSVSFNPTANLTVGDTVKLAYATETGWKLTGMALRKATDTPTNPQDISGDFTKLSDNNYQFTMPNYDVCVDFKCEEIAASGAEAGDFIISDANCSYSFDTTSRTLTLSGGGRATISMKSGVPSTSDCIKIAAGASINLTIKNLTVSAPQQGISGLTFPDDIGVCRLILEGTNQFTSNQEDTPAVHKQTRGKLTISGKGKLIAIATGAKSNGIGSNSCRELYIEGGTIYAKASHNNMAIGYGYNQNGSTVYYTGGTVEGMCGDDTPYSYYGGLTGRNAKVIITGGSIHSANRPSAHVYFSVYTHPTNGSDNVYQTIITLGEGATLAAQAYVTALTGAGTYGINQMHTDDEGKLYLWLPENTTVTKVETDKGVYVGSVTTNSANYFGTASAVFNLAEKQEGSGSVAIEGWTYGESAKAPVPTSTTNGTANVSYTYFTNEACTTKTTSDNSGAESIGSVPKNAGRYYIQATFAETPRYKAVIAKAGFTISKANVTFTPPTAKTGLTYTGEAQALINAGTVDAGIGKLTYSLSETGTYSETIPRAKDADTYRVYYKVVGTNANYDYTNTKGSVAVSIAKEGVTFTPPTAKAGLAYTGEMQELINAGLVDSAIGKLTYSLSETGTYSETIPRAKDAGTYTVYYKVAGTNSNYDYTNAKGNIAVSIAKVSITPTVVLADRHYGESPNTPTVIGNAGGGAVSYDYFTDEACTIKTTTENSGAESTGAVPKNAGIYYVKATIAESTNYNGATAKAGFKIKKAKLPFTPPTAKVDLSYTGELQELINVGSVDASLGKLTYSLSETGTYSETIPTAKDAGTYTVYYKAVGANANYDYTVAKGSVAVTIAKAEITPTVAIDGWTYGTSPNIPIVTGNMGSGAVTYEYFTDEACTAKTKAVNSLLNSEGGVPKNAGTYRVKASIAESTNYQGATAKAGFEIKKADQRALGINSVTGKKYGDTDFTLKATGGSGNGQLSYSVDNNEVLSITGNTAKIVGAGTVTITAKKAEDVNHNKASASISVIVAKKDLTIKAEDKTVIKDESMPTFTFTADGLVNGDTFTDPVFTTSAADTHTIGDYDIVVSEGRLKKSGGVDAENNYEVTYQKGKLTIVDTADIAHTVTVIDGTGGGTYRTGDRVTVKADDKPDATFTGWTSDDGVVFENAFVKETSFVMPAKNITVTANYSANSSGGSSSGGSGAGSTSKDDGGVGIKTGKSPDLPTTAEIAVKAKKGDDKTATAEISEQTVENAIKKAKEEAKKNGKEANGTALELNIAVPKGTDKVNMTLSGNTLGKIVSGEVKSLAVNGSFVKVVFDKNAILEIKKQGNGDVSVHITPVKKLSEEVKKLIENRPVYDISLSFGNGKKITDLGNGIATVFLFYKPEKNEAIGGFYAVYADEKEKASRIEPSVYDAGSSSVIFTTNHFSVYGVGYTAPLEKFDDIKKHWAKDFIDYVIGRGLLDASTENKFYPDEKMTRGMLATALGKLAGVNIEDYKTNSFNDVKNDSSYRPYIEWAYSKGIIDGVGDGKFAPDKSITREEMAVIFERYAKVTGYEIPVTRKASIYEDTENIGSEYMAAVKAMQQAGIMTDIDKNKFNPKGEVTRAEVSAMLSRYIKLTITPETAQGFVLDDAGKYRYYKDGKALTEKQILNGTVYFFDESGVLKTGWVKDGNLWRYYDGTKAHKGWLNLKADGEERLYYLNKEGLLESGKWVNIDGKWYYFYPDGTLALNTEIDGYKVDSEGVREEK